MHTPHLDRSSSSVYARGIHQRVVQRIYMQPRTGPIALTPTTGGFTVPNRLDLPEEDDDEMHGFNERRRPLRVRILELYRSNIGLLLIIGSQLFGVGMNTCVKLLQSFDPPVPPFEIIFVRQVATYFVSLYFLIRQRVPYPATGPPEVRVLLVLRGIFGFFGLFGMYYSLQYLSLPDAITITFLTPTTTVVVAYLLLGEQLARSELIAGSCSLLGVILIARPEFIFGHQLAELGEEGETIEGVTSAQRLSAVAMSLLGVLGGTGAFCSIRAIGKRASPLHSMTFFSLWCCIASSSGMLIFKTPIVWPNSISWVLLMIAISLCGFGTQLFLTMGLQRETASRGSLGTYSQIIFAEISGRLVFQSQLSVLGLIGTGILLTSALYVALTKNRKAPREVTGHIRLRSADKRGIETLRLGTTDTADEELRGLVSDDYSERSTLDLEDPRRSMENV